MAHTAYLPIIADRYGAVVRHIFVVGLDLTGIDMRAQVRLYGDVPGAPLVDLLTVANGNAQGLRLVEVTSDDAGLPTSHIELVINETTMEALPYAGEIGDVTTLAWDWQITIAGRKRRLAKGEFQITGDGVTGAEVAPINRIQPYGLPQRPVADVWSSARMTFGEEQVTVKIDGADLIAPFATRAKADADRASASEGSAADAALAAALAKDQAADLVRPENIFINVPHADAEAAVATGVTFKVVDTSTGDASVYRKPSGGIPLYHEATRERLSSDQGAASIGTRLPYAGSVKRTQAERNGDYVSVLDFIPVELHDAIRAGTDETDLSVFGQQALQTGKTVLFPAGRYHGHFDLPNGAKIIGEGRERTVLRNFGNAALLTIDNSYENRRGIQIEGMTLRNRNKSLYQQADGILINGPRGEGENDYHIFYDLLIFQFRYNVHMKGRSIWNRWVRCSFVESILDNFYAEADNNQAIQTFDTCRWAAAGRYGIRVYHTFEQFLLNGWTFIGCNFENNLWVPVRVSGPYGLQGWTFLGCYSEENTNSIPPGTNDGVVKSGLIMVDCPYAIGLVLVNCVFANNTAPHPNPDYYVYVADVCENVVGSISSCRGGNAGIISVYWKKGLDFGLNFGLTVNLDRSGGSRSAVDSVLAADFTPAVAFSDNTTGVVYSNRRGRYVINGSLLTFQAYIALASKGSSKGDVRLTGLPFAGQNIDNLMQTVAVAISESFNTKPDVHGQLLAGSPTIQVQATSGGVIVPLTDADMGNFTTFRISGSYLI